MSESTTQKKDGGHGITILFALIVGVLATILVIQNSKEVVINLWFWQIRTSLIILLGITLGLGLLISFLLMYGRSRGLKKENKRLRKTLKEFKEATTKKSDLKKE